jgi:hypothetical protein
MALTVHYSIKATVVDSAGNVVAEWKPRDISLTTSGDNYIEGAINTSTSAAAVPLGSVVLGAKSLACFRNMSSTAGENITIQEAGAATDALILGPGQEALCALDATGMAAFKADAATGTPVLKYLLVDP